MKIPPAPHPYSTDVGKELRASESRYRRLFETAQDGILLLNADTAQIEDVNPYLIDMLGYSHSEFLGKKLWEVGSFADRVESKEMFAELQTKGYVRYEDLPLKTKAGARVEVEFVSNTYDSEGIKVIQCNIRDITKRKAAEALLKRHTQLYAALSQCNKAIVHCVSEEELFLQVCHAAVQFGGMKLAWVGLVDTETLKVRPVAIFGDDTEYLKDINISVDADSPFGRGPTGTAIRENHLYWCQDYLDDPATVPWRERAVPAGLAAAAALPLQREGIVIGAFTLYSAETNAFDEAACDLLVEMATDISFALDNFARESQRRRAKQELEFKNTILQTQQEISLDAILVVDEDGQIISYNQQFIDLWRLSPQLVSARLDAPVLQSVVDQVENPEAFAARIRYLYEHRDEKSREEIPLIDGRIIDRYSAPVTGTDGKYYGRVWYFRDITERKQVEQELRIAATAFEVQESIIITDAHKVILRVNQSFTRLTGYSAEEAIGQTPALIKSGMQDDEFYQKMWEALNRDHSWQGEIWNRRKNGEVYPDWLTITAVTNAKGEVTNYVSSYADLSQYKKDEATIHSLAFYDPLTSLPNRRLLLDRLQHAFAASSRHQNHGALLFIDLDNFKALNDTKGHNIGDLLLVEVASRLHACVREADTVARLGGDEFVVLLENLSEDPLQAAAQTDAVCDQILTAFRQTYSLSGHEYHGSASIGISLFRNQEATVNEILKRADTAMYQAKSAGRNTLRFFDPDMQAVLEARTELESDLRCALEGNQFRLYYQAQVDHTGHILGAEALIRWQHPQRGLVSPFDFIPLAEEMGLILHIGQWVLETACTQLKIWEADPLTRNLQLAVNVSARQFHQPDFVEQVRQTLRIHAFNPGLLKLELTESLVLDNIDDAIVKMQALREVGVRFSMDDFGTGYSSLSYLTQLPLDQLKIDQSFVRNIGVKHSDAVIVQTIIGMANNLGMEVIAEGVETENQRAFLEQHGCTLCQGYLFGRPVPIEAFEEARLKSM
jgi:diguanylate cyclase (GGDEF)-like protein/PAS domain S-box-containing protein